MSEIFLTQKVVFEADAIFYLPPVNEFVFLPVSNTNKLSSNATNITHFHCSSTYFIDKQYLLCIEVCYDNEEQQQEGKTFACLS